MEFYVFANRLMKVASGGDSDNKAIFTQALFENILEIDDGKVDLEKITARAYRMYFSGERKINRLASKIRKYIEPEKFSAYINSLGADVQHDIFKEFAADCPGMSDINIHDSMAGLFKKIIEEAYASYNKGKKVSGKQQEPSLDKEDFVLLDECRNRCPICQGKLLGRKRSVPIPKFRRIFIFPLDLDSAERVEFEKLEDAPNDIRGLENQMVLCQDCAQDYEVQTTPREYAYLMQTKRELVRISEAADEAYDFKIEQGINEILDALRHLDIIPQQEDKTRWDAFRVDKKIPDDLFLQDRVTDNVLKYYRYIEEQFKQRERENRLRFNKIKCEISLCFETYDESGISKKEIYDRMVNWLSDKTNCDRDACAVMISFFVQNCEVFRDETAQ